MFEKLLSKFRKQDTATETASEPDQLELAVAAILVEAARADEVYADEEKAIIDHALGQQFKLDPGAAAALRIKGEDAQSAATDLHRFTKVVKEMPGEEKIALIETLWRIILSDGARDQYENALIRRICGLIYVDDREAGQARQRVLAEAK